MTIYTRTGDRGKTGLFSGERVAKDDAGIQAYGSVDELNSILGVLITMLPPERQDLIDTLRGVQADLFTLGAWLSVTPDSPAANHLQAFEGARIDELEAHIDTLQADLPALNSFILPGGHPSAAWSHVARSVCRRAERQVVGLYGRDQGAYTVDVYGTILRYLNRLSDYLFVLARYGNFIQGVEDIAWAP